MSIQEIGKYLKIVRKWWWVITVLFGTTVGTMLAIVLFSETQYEATVTVQVNAPPPQEVPLYSDFGREALSDEIAQTRASFSEFFLEGDTAYQALEVLGNVPMGVDELRSKMAIDMPDSSQLLRVRVRAADPEMAALLANTLVETGLKQYGEMLARPTANTRQFIEQELKAVREELIVAETELIQFQVDSKIGNLNSAINSQSDLIGSLKTQGDLAQVEGDTTRAQAIQEVIQMREAELQNVIGLSAQYTELVDRVERVRATHGFLLDRESEAQIKENQILELGSIQVITPARPPRRPVSAINSKLIVLGAVASTLIGVLLTFLLEYLEITGAFRGFQKRFEQSEMAVLSSQVN
jgi:uncharacterized protein involved in exopolysaccharide biosynthesis